MKKSKLILISLFAIFAFVSCGGGEDTSSSVEEVSISESVSTEETSSESLVSEYKSEESSKESSEELSMNSENNSINTPTSSDAIGNVAVEDTGEGEIIEWVN